MHKNFSLSDEHPAELDTVSIYNPPLPPTSMNRSTHTELDDRAAYEIMNALAYSLYLGKRFTHHITVHLDGAGITSKAAQKFVREYLRRLGDLVDRYGEGPRFYFWALENPAVKGLHLHAWVRVPKKGNLRAIFRERVEERWLRECGGTPGDKIVRIVAVSGREDSDLLDEYLIEGLEYGAGYLLKGWSKHESFGIKVRDKNKGSQGVVVGKRSATSKSLGRKTRNDDWNYSAGDRVRAFKALGWKLPPARKRR
jgi:hypothetical protein